jgi:coenzyme F420-0:L-glutamate ligase/coenzyme F420-1:gamma-L-glutamate ligase
MKELKVFGVTNLPEVSEGDDLTKLIIESLEKQGTQLENKDIVIVTSKIVSKAEGRLVALKEIQPSEFAIELSKSTNKSPSEIELILQQSARPRGYRNCYC